MSRKLAFLLPLDHASVVLALAPLLLHFPVRGYWPLPVRAARRGWELASLMVRIMASWEMPVS